MPLSGAIGLAALLTIQPGGDAGLPSSLRDMTLAAALEVCPGLVAGRLAQDDGAALASRGFRRQPQIEAQLPRTRPDSRPLAAVAGTAESGVFIAFWPDRGFCAVTFKGGQAEAALAALIERMRSDPAAFAPLAGSGEADWSAPLRFRGEAGLISLRRPPPGDESGSYTVTFERPS